MDTRLRTTMYAITIYLTVLGVMFLFLPGIVESIMGISLPDAGLTMLYGQLVLTLAYLGYYVARNVESMRKLYAVFVFLFVGHLLVWLYQLFTGISTFAQVGPPLVISVIFTVLLFMYGRE